MQLTLQITTGPHAGRKVLLRSGQVARVGRTEWADFSFPGDTELADVHFAVQCQLSGARLRKLAADRPLAVNSEEVSEAELKPGDVIHAGQSSFQVAFDGQTSLAQDKRILTGTAAAAAAGAVAGGAAAAKPTDDKQPTAKEIAEYLEQGDDVLAVAATVKTGPELVAALATSGEFAHAVRVQAHLLPKRHCVWWGLLCVEEVCGDGLTLADAAAKGSARTWVEDPSESHRRQCDAAAGKTKLDGPGSWLAMAAVWSGGSLMPPEMAPVAPDERLTGQAVTNGLMIAAVTGDATKGKARYRTFLSKAPAVASGQIPLPDKK
jgi:uncharacterized protein DUF6931/type III secretion system (T3SS) inner membrane Yop/YscD-like protein